MAQPATVPLEVARIIYDNLFRSFFNETDAAKKIAIQLYNVEAANYKIGKIAFKAFREIARQDMHNNRAEWTRARRNNTTYADYWAESLKWDNIYADVLYHLIVRRAGDQA